MRTRLFGIVGWCLSVGGLLATTGCGDDESAAATGGGSPPSTDGGGGGSFDACDPGVHYPCYSGPAPTKDVGACVQGSATCNEDGTALGPCEGEVLPAAETCLTPEDDDCDGPANEEGEGCVCEPGFSQPCYTGPAGTEGVGSCEDGTETCDQSGAMLSACVGEVTPEDEVCATPGDESCEGPAPDGCSGDYAAGVVFGDAADQTGRSIAFGADGSYVVAGSCVGVVDFGGGPLADFGTEDACVAKFDATGAHVWSRRYGDVASQRANGVAVAPNGDVVVVGSMQGNVDFGGGALSSAGAADAFVLRLTSAGAFGYAARFGGVDVDVAAAVDVGAGGEAIVTGSFRDQIDLGGAPLLSAGGDDVWVAVFAPAGTHLASMRFGDGTANQRGRAVSARPGGGFAVALSFTGSVNLGGGALVSAGNTDIGYGVFDSVFAFVQSNRYGDAQAQDIASIDFGPANALLLSGSFSGSLDFGLGNLNAVGEGDVYVARIDADGTTAWNKRFGDGEAQDGVATWASGGDVVVGGTLVGEMEFGGGAVSAADPDIYVARFDDEGVHLWSRIFGGAEAQSLSAIAVSPTDDRVRLTGQAAGTPDFGGGAVTTAGGDFLVLSLVP